MIEIIKSIIAFVMGVGLIFVSKPLPRDGLSEVIQFFGGIVCLGSVLYLILS